MTVRFYHAEIGTAAATGLLGVIGVIGAADLGFGWETGHGPEPGYFPFYVSLVLIGASIWNALAAIRAHRAPIPDHPDEDHSHQPFLTGEQFRRVGIFTAEMAVFVIASLTLGVYVACAAYIGWSAWRHGGYSPIRSFGIGIAFSAVQYVIFETIFRIPLLKGPLEAMLGIY